MHSTVITESITRLYSDHDLAHSHLRVCDHLIGLIKGQFRYIRSGRFELLVPTPFIGDYLADYIHDRLTLHQRKRLSITTLDAFIARRITRFRGKRAQEMVIDWELERAIKLVYERFPEARSFNFGDYQTPHSLLIQYLDSIASGRILPDNLNVLAVISVNDFPQQLSELLTSYSRNGTVVFGSVGSCHHAAPKIASTTSTTIDNLLNTIRTTLPSMKCVTLTGDSVSLDLIEASWFSQIPHFRPVTDSLFTNAFTPSTFYDFTNITNNPFNARFHSLINYIRLQNKSTQHHLIAKAREHALNLARNPRPRPYQPSLIDWCHLRHIDIAEFIYISTKPISNAEITTIFHDKTSPIHLITLETPNEQPL